MSNGASTRDMAAFTHFSIAGAWPSTRSPRATVHSTRGLSPGAQLSSACFCFERLTTIGRSRTSLDLATVGDLERGEQLLLDGFALRARARDPNQHRAHGGREHLELDRVEGERVFGDDQQKRQ